jgi:aminomethyltransferase
VGDELRRSALHDRHVALGAKLVPFGGWEMPLSYPRGTIEEHLACRREAVVFDVSHLGTVRVEGAGALERLQAAFTNDLGKIAPGRAQYTHLLDEGDASVLDDIIVWWIAEDVFDVMPNASNTARVLDAVGGDDVTATRAILAVQGPTARGRVGAIFPEAAAVGRFRVQQLSWQDQPVTVAGTGYTGEDGIEISVPAAAAGALWDALVGEGVIPAGLGARDTLRLEAALPLHGHELGPGITPLEAGLGWVVAWDKEFRGKAPLDALRRAGIGRKLRGLATEGRRPPRADCAVSADGGEVGVVTSGNYSPVLEHGIALAFLSTAIADGQTVEIDVRGTALPGVVVPTPFVAKR